jgi:hypothetical protein
MTPDIADIIAGELGVSRGTAYDMMREALADALPLDPCCWPGTSCNAPKPWVGLSEDEINKLRHLVDWTAEWSYGRFAYELERLLREKNT